MIVAFLFTSGISCHGLVVVSAGNNCRACKDLNSNCQGCQLYSIYCTVSGTVLATEYEFKFVGAIGWHVDWFRLPAAVRLFRAIGSCQWSTGCFVSCLRLEINVCFRTMLSWNWHCNIWRTWMCEHCLATSKPPPHRQLSMHGQDKSSSSPFSCILLMLFSS